MDFLYSLLKITSMIATGAFGALGLLTKYKNDQGKITKWGKVALGGILISSGISLSLYMLETAKAKTAAIKAQAEAKATKEKLETILLNAERTAEQQKRSLEETNLLKLGLEKTLERSDYIAQGMENSLAGQESVLSGNKEILSGVTRTVNEQRKQIEKLARLDLARLQLSGVQLSVTPKDVSIYPKLKKIFSEASMIELPDKTKVIPFNVRPCFEDIQRASNANCKSKEHQQLELQLELLIELSMRTLALVDLLL